MSNVLEGKVGKIVRIFWKTSGGKGMETVGAITASHPYETHGIDLSGSSFSIPTQRVVKVTATKVSPEVRAVYKEIFQQIKESNRISQEIKKLKAKERELMVTANKLKDSLPKLTGMIDIKEIIATFEDFEVYEGERGKDKLKLIFVFDKYVDKYARPDNYDFLDYEYDSTLTINNRQLALEQIGIKVREGRHKLLLEAIHGTNSFDFYDVRHFVSIGDKNTLTATMEYILSVPLSQDSKVLATDLIIVNDALMKFKKSLDLESLY